MPNTVIGVYFYFKHPTGEEADEWYFGEQCKTLHRGFWHVFAGFISSIL
jgi:hypothetical protein